MVLHVYNEYNPTHMLPNLSYPAVAAAQQTPSARHLLDRADAVPILQRRRRFRSVKLVVVTLALAGNIAVVDAQTSSTKPGNVVAPSPLAHEGGKPPRIKRSLPPSRPARHAPGTEKRSTRCPPYSAYVICN
ncbi:hypothetical protein ACQR10_15595 [Bradyrhizobium sp. HKCCYLRH2060]|uniref:hypothetical protein n=1 Tax=Bradyrhizobium TaxID=374 RepID=UPI0028E90AAA|nr:MULTISPECIES: hypothetical protein [unclassified Bradyrhizobium]